MPKLFKQFYDYMGFKSNPTIKESLYIELKILNMLGYYRSEKVKVNMLYYRAAGIAGTTIIFWQTFSFAIRAALDIHSFEKILRCIYVINTFLACICKGIPFVWRMHRVTYLVDHFIEHPMFNQPQTEQKANVQTWAKQLHNTTVTIRFMMLGTIILFAIFPYLSDQLASVPGWTPSFIDDEKLRSFINAYITVAYLLIAETTTAFDFVATSMITIGRAQLSQLKDNIRSATQLSSAEEAMDAEGVDEIVANRLKKCVQQHVFIIQYIEYLGNTLALGIFLQFCNSLMTLCLTAVQFLMVPVRSLQFVSMWCFFFSMLSQVVLYTFYGQRIMDEGDELIETCYFTKWYDCGPKVRRMLFIIMERAKRPSYLTAGQIIILQLPTLLSILRTSYSLFAVINRLYSDDAE